jgi:Serine dehydrogenase proteinase
LSKKNRRSSPRFFGGKQPLGIAPAGPAPRAVASLLDEMVDGNEYGSIVALRPENGDLVPELRRGITELEAIRGRRCICYVANVIKDLQDTSISASDHLPFNEMVDKVSDGEAVDVFLVTPGGFAEQVTLFVDALRSKFKSVEFILPYKAMSAGTLWALSGERIWMDRRACIGPVDPQVPSSDNRLVPAQALLTLLEKIQTTGNEALKRKQNPPWAYIRLLDQMDQRQLGAALAPLSTCKISRLSIFAITNFKLGARIRAQVSP